MNRAHHTLIFVLLLACACLSLMLLPRTSTAEPVAAVTVGPTVPVLSLQSASVAIQSVASALDRWRQPRPALRHVKRIVIDPGHGGTNEGAIGVGRIHEKHLPLAMAYFVAERLRARYPGLEVELTRYQDVDLGLSKRAEIANSLDADLFMSFHFNAAVDHEAHGYETFWVADTRPVLPRQGSELVGMMDMLPTLPAHCEERAQAAQHASGFAHHLHQAYKRRTQTMDRGVKRANFTVLRRANVPALVVEFGFLTHAGEGMQVIDPNYQALLGDAVVEAIGQYDRAAASDQAVAQALEVAQPVAAQIRFK